MRGCAVASHIIIDNVRITVGVASHDGTGFLVLCLQDYAGCQHITTQTKEAVALIERICRMITRAQLI